MSQVVPGIHAYYRAAEPGVEHHTLEFTEASRSELGLSGMIVAAKAMALTALALAGDAAAVRDMVMTEDSVDVPPRPLSRQQPRYPPRARADSVEGQVTLGLLIGPDGRVLKVKVLDATPPGVFDGAAQDSVRGWRFQPAQYRGQSVKVWARQVVHFDLS